MAPEHNVGLSWIELISPNSCPDVSMCMAAFLAAPPVELTALLCPPAPFPISFLGRCGKERVQAQGSQFGVTET